MMAKLLADSQAQLAQMKKEQSEQADKIRLENEASRQREIAVAETSQREIEEARTQSEAQQQRIVELKQQALATKVASDYESKLAALQSQLDSAARNNQAERDNAAQKMQLVRELGEASARAEVAQDLGQAQAEANLRAQMVAQHSQQMEQMQRQHDATHLVGLCMLTWMCAWVRIRVFVLECECFYLLAMPTSLRHVLLCVLVLWSGKPRERVSSAECCGVGLFWWRCRHCGDNWSFSQTANGNRQ